MTWGCIKLTQKIPFPLGGGGTSFQSHFLNWFQRSYSDGSANHLPTGRKCPSQVNEAANALPLDLSLTNRQDLIHPGNIMGCSTWSGIGISSASDGTLVNGGFCQLSRSTIGNFRTQSCPGNFPCHSTGPWIAIESVELDTRYHNPVWENEALPIRPR